MIRSALALALAAAGLLALPGCLFGSSTRTTSSGRYVSHETLARVSPGDSADSVVGMLGEPSSKSTRADGSEIWTWRYRQEKTRRGSVLFVLGSKSTTETAGAVHVELRDGVVVKSWRDA